jgi:hypothetical protein
MTMTRCRECGAEVSSDAKKCPKCGIDAPAKTKYTLQLIGGSIIWVLIAGFLFSGWWLNQKSKDMPPPPITMEQREAFTADSLVAIINNASSDMLHNVNIYLYDPQGKQIKANRLDAISPRGFREIGPLEGWHFLGGYSIKVRVEGFAPKTWTFR